MLKLTLKVILAAIGVSVLFAAPSFAAHHKKNMVSPEAMSAPATASDSITVVDPSTGQVIGADPDPNIRAALIREAPFKESN